MPSCWDTRHPTEVEKITPDGTAPLPSAANRRVPATHHWEAKGFVLVGVTKSLQISDHPLEIDDPVWPQCRSVDA